MTATAQCARERAHDHEFRYRAPGLLARLIALHREALILKGRWDRKAHFDIGERCEQMDAARGETQARREIIGYEPNSREEAMSKLAYLAAVLVATRSHLDDEELVALAVSIASFKRRNFIQMA